jgi:hypothetical protein
MRFRAARSVHQPRVHLHRLLRWLWRPDHPCYGLRRSPAASDPRSLRTRLALAFGWPSPCRSHHHGPGDRPDRALGVSGA